MKPELLLTDDGSHTLFLPDKNESYHSRFGALQESHHIFIQNGLLSLEAGLAEIKILEAGFGTGLNALLSLQHSLITGIPVEYTAIEAFPLGEEIYARLNYADLPQFSNVKEYFLPLHHAQPDEAVSITRHFTFRKIFDKIEDAGLRQNYFNLVYYDAFSPAVQPELWTEDIFRRIGNAMVAGGLLLTYTCKGSVKRSLRAAGFETEKLPGPPGKREFLRAVRKPG